MPNIVLTYPTPDGSKEIRVDEGKTNFGRGSEAEWRFADDGLSRLHATIYRDGDNVWIVDENSSNGTFVNGQKVIGAGTPLSHGDSIRIGHRTELNVRISESTDFVSQPAPIPSFQDQTVHSSAPSGMSILPVAIIAFAIMAVSISAVFIGYTVLGSGSEEVVRSEFDDYPDEPTDRPLKSGDDTATTPIERKSDPKKEKEEELPEKPVKEPNIPPPTDVLKGRKYYELSDSEKRQYLNEQSMRIAQIIGNNSSDSIPAPALDKIKSFTDGFVSRRNSKSANGCSSRSPWRDNLEATYKRASENAPFIIRAFNQKGVDPRIGLYLAMIESEHCVCLQSHTGPLGMFQFAYATAKLHFEPSEGVIKGATPGNPDLRCEPEPAARGAASYMKSLTARFGTGPASVPLAIGSYNSGEGGLSSNLVKALETNKGLPRDFWTLIANGDKLSEQFRSENFKYVPKFFAAAIIGENPKDFGLSIHPLSTYSK